MGSWFQYLSSVIRIARTHQLALFRYAIIVATLSGMGFAYAFAVGWVAWPAHEARPSPKQIVNAFEASAGSHPGFRRNHAKGLCVLGHFESNGDGTALSRASVFERGVVPVVGRLSIPGGDPGEQDGNARVRSFALRFTLRDGEEWRTAMNSVPVFMVRKPEDLYAELVALRRDKTTGKADPTQFTAFIQKHPETRAFEAWTINHPPSSGFDNAPYFSVNAFRFIDAHGTARYVRWSVVPETPYQPVSANEPPDPDFLAHEFTTRVERGPVRWHLIVTVAKPGDPTDDATQLWPRDRERVDTGTLVIENAQTQIDGPCRDINFDPLVLPAGIEPSRDPLLAARSAAYGVSLKRRLQEEAHFESKR